MVNSNNRVGWTNSQKMMAAGAAAAAALILVLWLSGVFSGQPADAALQDGAPSEEGGADITITPDGCVKPSVEDDPFGLWDMISGADPEKDCRITWEEYQILSEGEPDEKVLDDFQKFSGEKNHFTYGEFVTKGYAAMGEEGLE